MGALDELLKNTMLFEAGAPGPDLLVVDVLGTPALKWSGGQLTVETKIPG
jgi:hypothetical protein